MKSKLNDEIFELYGDSPEVRKITRYAKYSKTTTASSPTELIYKGNQIMNEPKLLKDILPDVMNDIRGRMMRNRRENVLPRIITENGDKGKNTSVAANKTYGQKRVKKGKSGSLQYIGLG